MEIDSIFVLYGSLFFLLGYFLGSVPYGVIIGKVFCGIDPRYSGSKNIGATNMSRLCGKRWGFLTLFCDLFKGALAVVICYFLRPSEDILYLLFPAFGALFGHMHSIFLKFKGGKGVATTVGIYLALSPYAIFIAALICIAVIAITGYVSAGALAMCVVLPMVFFFTGNMYLFGFSLLTGAFVVFAHKQNIVRLIKGEEKSWRKVN